MKILLLLLFFLLCSVSSFSKAKAIDRDTLLVATSNDSTVASKKTPTQLWITLGFTGGHIQKEFLTGITAGVDYQLSHHLFSARLISGRSYQEDIQPVEKALEVGLLYGYGVNNSLWYANASVGLSYVSETRRVFDHKEHVPNGEADVYRAEKYSGIGLPWQGRVFSKFSDSSNTGLGFALSGDVNKPGSFFFISLILEIFIL